MASEGEKALIPKQQLTFHSLSCTLFPHLPILIVKVSQERYIWDGILFVVQSAPRKCAWHGCSARDGSGSGAGIVVADWASSASGAVGSLRSQLRRPRLPKIWMRGGRELSSSSWDVDSRVS